MFTNKAEQFYYTLVIRWFNQAQPLNDILCLELLCNFRNAIAVNDLS